MSSPSSAVWAPLLSYGSLARVDARLDALSGRAALRRLGATVRGAPLRAAVVGPTGAARTTVVVAGLHALEWIGVQVALALLERLAADPPRDRRVVIVPVVNVDGVAAVEADLRAARRRFRRTNDRGVDLNRNWPTHHAVHRRPWRWIAGDGGAAPASEPEIATVLAALDDAHAAAPIDRALSLHSFGRMLLVPWGGRWARPDGHGRLRAAAAAIAARLAEPYRVRQVSHWLPGAFAHGLEIDHLHARYGATAVLVECTLGGILGRRPRPAELLQPFRWYNPPDPAPAVAALADALEPFARGDEP